MKEYYIRENSETESYQIMEYNGITDDGEKEDAIIADFYMEKPFVDKIVKFLNSKT